jgi:phosphatidylglycerol lysyltransferase
VSEPAPVKAPWWRRLIKPVLTIGMFAFMIYGFRRMLGSFDADEVMTSLRETAPSAFVVAVALLVGQHCVYIVRERLSARFAGHEELSWGETAVASLVSRSLSTLGLATITGFALRLRLYEAFGLKRADVTRLTLYNESTFYVGQASTFAFVFLLSDIPDIKTIGMSLPSPTIIGVAAAGLVAAYVGMSLARTRPWKIWKFELPVVRGVLLAGQVAIPLLEMLLGVGIVWICLPEEAGLTYFETATACALAGLAGSISQVPGGLGVFETVVLQFVPESAHGPALAGLLVRRVIVNLVPLAVGTVALVGFEVTTRPGAAVPLGWRRQTVATALAVTAFFSGVLLLVAATLGEGGNFSALGVVGQAILFADGFGTLLVSRGLHLRRVQSWRFAVLLFFLRAVIALLAGPAWFSLIISAAIVGLLAAGHRAFPEHDLARDDDTAWIAAFIIAVAGICWLALVTNPHPDHINRITIARGAGIITAVALVTATAVERYRRRRKLTASAGVGGRTGRDA